MDERVSHGMRFLLQFVVGSDSSAARGICTRLGAGRVRHLQARELWIQERVLRKELSLRKVATETNRADIQTKPCDPVRHTMFLGLLSVRRFSTGCAIAAVTGFQTAFVALIVARGNSLPITVLEGDGSVPQRESVDYVSALASRPEIVGISTSAFCFLVCFRCCGIREF